MQELKVTGDGYGDSEASRQNVLCRVFTLAKNVKHGWRKLKAAQRLTETIAGIEFKDGVPECADKIVA